MEIIGNENLYDQSLTPFESLLGQLLLNQIIKKAEQHMKEKGCENLLEYVTGLLLEYYSKNHYEQDFKSDYYYKTKRNGNRKREIHSSEN
jgi:hypothetical protein